MTIKEMVTTELIPNPTESDRQYARYHHLDIAGSDDTALIDEANFLQSVLWGLPRDSWLRERVRLLRIELAKRRGKK